VEGVTPLPEERNGRYFKPEYWARQRALAQGMLLAQKRMSQARSAAVAQAQAEARARASAEVASLSAVAQAGAVPLN
jgi:hypothetical protein